MPLKILVTVLIRLFAIYWLISGVSRLAAVIPFVFLINQHISETTSPMHNLGMVGLYYLLEPLGIFGISAVLWFCSSAIASGIVKQDAGVVTAISLAKEDVCQLGLIFLGLYFVISSFVGLVAEGLKFFGYDFSVWKYDEKGGQFIWFFVGHTVTALAGIACMLYARLGSRWLIRANG